MAIKRQPHNPMFKIMHGKQELMRFRAKNDRAATVEAHRQTKLLKLTDLALYRLHGEAGWWLIGELSPSYNQHPNYEEWKNICPNCHSTFTAHNHHEQFDSNSAAEDRVTLKCTDCGHVFWLREAFEAELARSMA